MSNSTSAISYPGTALEYIKGLGKGSHFRFPSNPNVVLRKHRMPELVAYLAKNDRDSIEVLLSDAFKAEAYKHNMSLSKVIEVAKAFLDAERAEYKAAVTAAKEAAQQAKESKAMKPINLGEVA